AIIDNVAVFAWNKPVKIGFEIHRGSLEEANKKLKRKLKNIQSKNKKLIKDKRTLKKDKSKVNKQLQKAKQKIDRYIKANKKLNNQITVLEHERDQIKQSYDKILQ